MRLINPPGNKQGKKLRQVRDCRRRSENSEVRERVISESGDKCKEGEKKMTKFKIGDTIKLKLGYCERRMVQLIGHMDVINVNHLHYHLQDGAGNNYQSDKYLVKIHPMDEYGKVDRTRSL